MLLLLTKKQLMLLSTSLALKVLFRRSKDAHAVAYARKLAPTMSPIKASLLRFQAVATKIAQQSLDIEVKISMNRTFKRIMQSLNPSTHAHHQGE